MRDRENRGGYSARSMDVKGSIENECHCLS